MCGLVYCKDFRKSRKGVNFKAIELYKKQKNRGRQGFGYYSPDNNRFVHNTEEKRILRLLGKERGVSEILFHHRLPTSTDNTRQSAHPFSTRPNTGGALKHTYIGMHNGVISNAHTLKDKHKSLDIAYVSQNVFKFNDSEALIYELALYFEGKQPSFDAIGSMAWIMIELDDSDKPLNLHFGRNSRNPLKIHRKRGKFLTLTSEGQGTDVQVDTHYVMSYKTGEITKTAMEMKTSLYSGRTWNAKTQSYDEDRIIATPSHKALGYNTETNHKHELVAPNQKNVSLAGHRWANGSYDKDGIWHPLETTTKTPALDAAGFDKRSFFTPAQKLVYADDIPALNIKKFVEEILDASDYDVDVAKTLIDDRLIKAREVATVAGMKMEGQGPVVLDIDTFRDLDERLWSAEADVYIYEEALKSLTKLTSEELAEMYVEQQSKFEAEVGA